MKFELRTSMNKACPDPPSPPPSEYPPKLAAIVSLFEGLPEDEKRETLISYADQAARCAPVPRTRPTTSRMSARTRNAPIPSASS